MESLRSLALVPCALCPPPGLGGKRSSRVSKVRVRCLSLQRAQSWEGPYLAASGLPPPPHPPHPLHIGP